MRTGEIIQGYCASPMDHFKQLDSKLNAESVLTPKFYKYTLELVSINPVVGVTELVGR